MSEKVGKKRSTVSNYLRLLKLPAEIQMGLRSRSISMGQARAIINIEDTEKQLEIYRKIVEEDLSVRMVEALVRELDSPSKPEKVKTTKELSDEYNELKKHLSEFFKTNIGFSRDGKGKGKIVIPFKSDDELEQIIAILDRAKA